MAKHEKAFLKKKRLRSKRSVCDGGTRLKTKNKVEHIFPRVVNHFRALGCSVSKLAVKRRADEEAPPPSHVATLKIPLNFPKARKGRKQKT